ncbi:MAG: hypothetical protein K8T10_00525 [Candidatus Eremiobacteraeota bacterium]|nr:hypothetical protein [Candidatus Eremiobacteraeota bacterium]
MSGMNSKILRAGAFIIPVIFFAVVMMIGCGGGGGGSGTDPTTSPTTSPTASPSPSPTYTPTPTPTSTISIGTWSVKQNGTILEIAYSSGVDFPQYVALHTNSGYWRMIPGRDSGWGTSVIVTPSFWENSSGSAEYHQGTDVTVTWQEQGSDLLVNYSGTISGLNFEGTILLSPPAQDTITATVHVTTSGNINLADKPDEAFKPVMLSSMHISNSEWDCSESFIGSTTNSIPEDQWLVSNPITDMVFGLKGGTSDWKINAPTIKITLPSSMPVTGWVTPGSNPNDDNIGMWPASNVVLRSWNYMITASKQ